MRVKNVTRAAEISKDHVNGVAVKACVALKNLVGTIRLMDVMERLVAKQCMSVPLSQSRVCIFNAS